MNVKMTRFLGRAYLTLRKISPELATGAGLLLGGATVIVVGIRSTKIVPILDGMKGRTAEIKEAVKDEELKEYGEAEAKHDLALAYVETTKEIIKLYALPAGLGIASVALILTGHGLLRKENAALAAAYMALNEGFARYRRNVIADSEDGKEKDIQYMTGAKSVGDGIFKIENEILEDWKKGEAHYNRIFDKFNPNWTSNPLMRLGFLKGVQNYCNDKLHAYGYLFLNDVYEQLGYEPTSYGQYIGWTDYGDEQGHKFVDFGLFDLDPDRRRFTEGDEEGVILNFNVDGPILHVFDKVAEDIKTFYDLGGNKA